MQYHYAKVGSGISEYRTNRINNCPDGLIKMKSPPPHYDWIASEEGLYLEILPTTEDLFNKEIHDLNEKHYNDVLEATNQYNVAVARDGSTEGDKVAVARAILADIDAQHELDQLAIIEKYYGA